MPRRPPPAAGVLGDSHDDDFWRLDGCESREERVIPVFEWDLLRLEALDEIEADDLCRTRFSGDVDPGHLCAPPRPAWIHHDALQPARHHFEDRLSDHITFTHCGCRLFHDLPVPGFAPQNDSRFDEHPPVGDHGVGDRQLNRCRQIRSLSDRQGNRLSIDPALLARTHLPLRRGDQTRHFTSNRQPGRASEPEEARITCQGLHTERLPQLVEVDITGSGQSLFKIHRTMPRALPTAIGASTEPEMPWTGHDRRRVDHALREPRRGDDRLVGRARRIDTGDRAISQGPPVIVVEGAPTLSVDPARKGIRIVGGRRNQSEDVAVARIESHERPHLVRNLGIRRQEGPFGDLLEIEIEAQDESTTRGRLETVDLLDLASRHVHHQIHAARTSPKMAFIRRLDPRLSDRLTGPVILVGILTEFLCIDLSNRPEQLGRQRAVYIITKRLSVEFDPGHRITMCGHLGLRLDRKILRQVHGLKSPAPPRLSDTFRNLARILTKDRAQDRIGTPGIADLVGNQIDAIGESTRCDRATLAVHDRPALGFEPDGTDIIRLRAARERLPFENL